MHSPRGRRSDSPIRRRPSSPGMMSGMNKSPDRRDRNNRSPLRRGGNSPQGYRTSSPGRRSPGRRNSPIGARRSTTSPQRRSPGGGNRTSLSPQRQQQARRTTPSPSRGGGMNNNKRRRDEREARRETDRKHMRDDRRSIYIGNLPYDIRKEELRALCSHYGDVYDVTLGARGFGFVYMDARGCRRALNALDKRTFGGRILHVNEAFKEDR